MIYFNSDYLEGAHPAIMERLMQTNMEQTVGYGEDEYCAAAREKIKAACQAPDADVHFLVGGTLTNTTVIASILRPYQGVLSATSGHINCHETGAIEATGHKVCVETSPDGKVTPAMVEAVLARHDGTEHMVSPKMVYISDTTEIGTVYTKAELTALRDCCKKHDLYFYIDGARLGTALTWPGNDVELTDLAELADGFYIGGTKLGALFGEALVILDNRINDHFRYMVKRACALLAKGRLIAVQMQALLAGGKNSLYYQLARHENEMAIKLAKGVTDAGYQLWIPHQTNQVFVIMNNDKIAELEKEFFFYTWCPYDDHRSVIRLVTNWNTQESEVDALLRAL